MYSHHCYLSIQQRCILEEEISIRKEAYHICLVYIVYRIAVLDGYIYAFRGVRHGCQSNVIVWFGDNQ